MAATEAGALLTEAHRLAQAQLSAETVARMLVIWPLLDPADLSTASRWLTAARPLIEAQRGRSESIAREYLRRFRAVELGAPLDDFTQPTIPPVDPRQVAISLTAEGPARIATALRAGRSAAEASQVAAAATAGTGSRLVLNGGSELIVASAQADPSMVGVRRVTSPGCCSFCALLAARSVDGLTFDFQRPHKGCHCQPETAVEGGFDMATEQARAFHSLYQESTSGVRGGSKGKQNAFRRALTAQRQG